MTDARMGAPVAAGGAGTRGFIGEALASLRDRRLVVPALALAVLLTVSNIVILRNVPVPGDPPILFAAAALVRIVGLLVLAVAILRIMTASVRAPYRLDGAFWLYGLTFLAGIALTAALGLAAGNRDDPVVRALLGAATILISAPFAPWFAAIAVERPLALNPAPWLRRVGWWLPPLLVWSLLVILPLGQAHAAIDHYLVRGAGEYFWPLALFDGPFSALMALFGLALAATAYRRVARG